MFPGVEIIIENYAKFFLKIYAYHNSLRNYLL